MTATAFRTHWPLRVSRLDGHADHPVIHAAGHGTSAAIVVTACGHTMVNPVPHAPSVDVNCANCRRVLESHR